MKTSLETKPRPAPTRGAGPAPTASVAAEGFSLAERYALLDDAALERLALAEAEAEVISSAYEGIPLDGVKLKAELLATYREIRAEQQR